MTGSDSPSASAEGRMPQVPEAPEAAPLDQNQPVGAAHRKLVACLARRISPSDRADFVEMFRRAGAHSIADALEDLQAPSLSPEAMQVAREIGLEGETEALSNAAKCDDPDGQIAELRYFAFRREALQGVEELISEDATPPKGMSKRALKRKELG